MSWKFKIGEIWSQRVRSLDFEQEEDFSFEEKGEIKITEPVYAEGSFQIIDDRDLLVKFNKIETTVEITCQKCLEPFEEKIEIYDRATLFTDELTPDKISEDYFEYDFGHKEIDLTEALREEILLSLPFRKVCNEECKGLCPGCGVNLNKEKCKCKK